MAKRKDELKVTIVGAEKPQEPTVYVPPLRPQLDFDSWWLMTQHRLKLKPELKEAIKKHFMARGFMARKDFDAGLIDFGIKS